MPFSEIKSRRNYDNSRFCRHIYIQYNYAHCAIHDYCVFDFNMTMYYGVKFDINSRMVMLMYVHINMTMYSGDIKFRHERSVQRTLYRQPEHPIPAENKVLCKKSGFLAHLQIQNVRNSVVFYAMYCLLVARLTEPTKCHGQ